ncbi:fructose PTS transporter subunit IIB (plasmid) [Ligilactobacillus salivarius]|uniref:Fructose PTS transporter subunit IIB n=1 Tax=Ligilactobacillus salivarius TaxID=1624 RepID=A0ABD7YXC3_9LACO|nr:fructose PTS transporter subunit IIB [Ligilactobacillus salivarius]MBL1070162.1 PTS fructose transporter subunit IIB [Ligilactobacillus salivarius]WHS05062.1 fructose PTS transporter subunit IIB [Ligilactobacillus salivarius]WHS09149.1 fructose PTS transporter subunit IIB [Ligilactobacillus salivarius]WHS11172.1 fructose PTS transporter subunit IIB [Ligilactobacillus salivarius]WHS15212.1 fructose PTS transporter subunit IIB [Ligilactobacillus salivarius]
MNIVGVTSCTVGIAHTYMAREKLITTAKELGMVAHIETQGSAGTENKLTDEDIRNADVAIIAADVAITGEERFSGIPVVKVPTNTAIQTPQSLLKTVEKKLKAAGKV